MSMVRVLLSEGSSTSAREAITALSLAGHEVSYCDPNPLCLSHFSRLVSHRYRCPPLSSDPQGFRDFVGQLLATGRFDVLLPIHEQGYLFSLIADEIRLHAALALPCFDSYARAHAKTGFGRLLQERDLRQPRTETIHSTEALPSREDYPYVAKIDMGTASRGTWLVRNRSEHDRARTEIKQAIAPGEPILLQEWVSAPFEQAQSVFQDGRLVGFHATRRLIEGAGGGAALKESVNRPQVQADLERIGQDLAWHGALSVDYFADEEGRRPIYVDCNPRLVEPMAATLAGANLADLLVRISLGERIETPVLGHPGIRSRLALQALLGTAHETGSRRAVLRTGLDAIRARNAFAGSAEELNPARLDPTSAVPVMAAALSLLLRPASAETLARRGWGSHLLTPRAAQVIRSMR